MECSVPVMGWPLGFVILSRRRRISVRDENDSSVIRAGAWCSPSRPLAVTNIYPTYYFYRDPSLLLRMTVGSGKAHQPPTPRNPSSSQ